MTITKANKQSFIEGINADIKYDAEFFKKLYGYSVCDDLFMGAVSLKLRSIERIDIIKAYNEWYISWKAEDDKQMSKVGQWYQSECDKEWARLQKVNQERAAKEWKLKRIDLLLRKKSLLLSMQN